MYIMMSPIVELIEETMEGGKNKNDREWIIFKHITYVWEQDSTKHTETAVQYRVGEEGNEEQGRRLGWSKYTYR
jgi:hypothetical protein